MTAVPTLFKRKIPIAMTFIIALVVALQYGIEHPYIITSSNTLKIFGVVVSSIAIILASLTLVISQMGYVVKKKADYWVGGLASLIFFAIFFSVGLVRGIESVEWAWIQKNIFSACTTALMGVAGFLFVSASYRAYKAKNIDGYLLLASGLLVMLSNTPAAVVLWPTFGPIGKWIMSVLNTNVQRAILVTVALGTVATAIRTVLGWQRGYMD